MREVEQVISDQMDYILSKLYANALYNSQIITRRDFNKVIKLLKKKYDPPTEMMERYNGKKNSKNN